MKIILIGKPIAKMRPRFSMRAGYVVTYDPQEEAKESVRLRFTEAIKKALDSEIKAESMDASAICLAKAYEVNFYFYLPINESDSIAVRNGKLWGFEMPTGKPDYDNLEKFYLDCANGVLWRDDSMIVDAHSHKRYDEIPRMEVTIMAKKELTLPDKAEKVIKNFSPNELKEFLYEVKKLNALDPEMVGFLEGDLLQSWLYTAAGVLSSFALKYAPLLKKIEKVGDVTKDIEEIEDCKKGLEEGRYAIEKTPC